MNTNDSRFELIRRCRDGAASAVELAQVESCLLKDADFRLAYVRYMNLDVALNAAAKAVPIPETIMASPLPRRNVWLSWRPLTAAAAGIVFGMFCTSVVFAYVGPSLGKVITLLDESFESGPASLLGVPVEDGRWSGDDSEIVGEQQGVKPAHGNKMLRLLRPDFPGKDNEKASYNGDIYRLIDMRPYRSELADSSAVAQFSAAFNAIEFPAGEIYEAAMTLYAFDSEAARNDFFRGVGHMSHNAEGCLAVARAGKLKLDRNPATWQRLTSDLRLPANAEFLMIQITIPSKRGEQVQKGFAGHYVDDARLSLRHSPVK